MFVEPETLIPEPWRPAGGCDDVYVFNPAVGQFHGSAIMAYRVVLPDGRRRIAICRLDEALRVRPQSVVALSDLVAGAGCWHADPRLCVAGDRLFVHFNTGLPAEGPNEIFVVELDAVTLHPLGSARALTLSGRRTIEKNWMLFECEGDIYAVYSVVPHVVLRLDLGSRGAVGPIGCRRVHEVSWDASDYVRRFGELRGGTPPMRVGDTYASFFHSTYPLQRILRSASRRVFGGPAPMRTYVGGFYTFSAAPPFAPVMYTPVPVLRAPRLPWRHRQRLDPSVARFVYPGGAILRERTWIISSGLQHEYCWLHAVGHDELMSRARTCRVVTG